MDTCPNCGKVTCYFDYEVSIYDGELIVEVEMFCTACGFEYKFNHYQQVEQENE